MKFYCVVAVGFVFRKQLSKIQFSVVYVRGLQRHKYTYTHRLLVPQAIIYEYLPIWRKIEASGPAIIVTSKRCYTETLEVRKFYFFFGYLEKQIWYKLRGRFFDMLWQNASYELNSMIGRKVTTGRKALQRTTPASFHLIRSRSLRFPHQAGSSLWEFEAQRI